MEEQTERGKPYTPYPLRKGYYRAKEKVEARKLLEEPIESNGGFGLIREQGQLYLEFTEPRDMSLFL